MLVLISISITLALLEIAVRFLPPPYNQNAGDFYVCHSDLGWTGRPHFSGTIGDRHFTQAVTFNAAGMHDADHDVAKAADTVRILMLGDSFVHAVQVAEAETAHQVLEDYLNAQEDAASSVEVISGGVINWGTNQQLVYYRQQGRHFQPDVVLLMLYVGNDLLDNLPGNRLTIGGRNCYAPYFAVCEETLNPAPLTYAPGVSRLAGNCGAVRRGIINGLGRLYQRSRLYQQLEPLLVARQPRQVFGQEYASPFSALYLANDEAELAAAWRVTEATLLQFQQEVAADGAQFVVALISPDIAVRLATLSPAEQQLFLQDNPRFAKADLGQPTRRLTEFLTGHNISVLDLTQPLAEHLATYNEPLYILGDGHWTVVGNRLAGERLGQWLITEGLIGASPPADGEGQ